MAQLSDLDLAGLCAGLYEAALDPALMTGALEQVREAFGFEAFHQFVVETQTGAHVMEWANQRISQDDMAVYAAHYFANDPRPAYASRLGVGELFVSSDFIDPKLQSRSELFQDFLLPRGVRHCVGAQLVATPDQVAYIAMLERKDRAADSPERRHHLSQLMPHVSRSLTLLLNTRGLQERLAASEQALNETDPAVLTLTAKLRLVTANKRAESLLRRQRFLRTEHGYVACSADTGGKELDALLQRVLLVGTPESCVLFDKLSGEQAHLTVSRIYNTRNGGFSSGGALLLMLTEPGRRRIATVKQLMELLHATPAEAHLARALAQGVEPNDYASENKIKVSTVRSQIKALMEKAQVNRMPDLVRVILSVAVIRA